MIQRLTREGYLIIQSTHDPNHALQYANYVLILQEGNLTAKGVPSEILTSKQLESIYQVPVTIHKIDEKGKLVCLPNKKE